MWSIQDILGLVWFHRRKTPKPKKSWIELVFANGPTHTESSDLSARPLDAQHLEWLKKIKHDPRWGIPKYSHGARSQGPQWHSGRWDPQGRQRRGH